MKALKNLLQELDELALTYATTPEDTSLELVILNKLQYILANYATDLYPNRIDLPNIYVEFDYDDIDGYCCNFELDFVRVNTENDEPIEFDASNFDKVNEAVNGAFELAGSDDRDMEATKNYLRNVR